MFFSKYFTFISREESLKGIKICYGLQSSSESTDSRSLCLQFVQGPIIWFCLRDDLLYKGTSTVSDYPIHRTTWPQEQNISLVLPELLPLGVVVKCRSSMSSSLVCHTWWFYNWRISTCFKANRGRDFRLTSLGFLLPLSLGSSPSGCRNCFVITSHYRCL